jgi:hypothetical protein
MCMCMCMSIGIALAAALAMADPAAAFAQVGIGSVASPDETPPLSSEVNEALARAAQPVNPNAHETKDRLTDAQRRALVEQPLAKVEAGDLVGGERDFEFLLEGRRRESGPNSISVADTLTAFGVCLFLDNRENPDPAMRQLAITYLRRVVDASSAAFGPDDPEVALSLNDFADAVRTLSPDAPPQEVDVAYERAYRIRLARLGPTDAETAASLAYLATVRGLPSRLAGDRAKLDEAVSMFREAIRTTRLSHNSQYDDSTWMCSRLAHVYVNNKMAVSQEDVFGRLEPECRAASR